MATKDDSRNHDDQKKTIVEEGNVLKEIKRNITREKKFIQVLKKEDIKKYVQECFKCQQNKVHHQRKAEELHPLDIPQESWQEISIDIIGPLPKLNGIDAIMVIIN